MSISKGNEKTESANFVDGLYFVELGEPFETEYNGKKYKVTIEGFSLTKPDEIKYDLLKDE